MPTYERGDYVKVEFPDETTGVGEWMWVRVHHCDEEKKLVFGTLDNEPSGGAFVTAAAVDFRTSSTT